MKAVLGRKRDEVDIELIKRYIQEGKTRKEVRLLLGKPESWRGTLNNRMKEYGILEPDKKQKRCNVKLDQVVLNEIRALQKGMSR